MKIRSSIFWFIVVVAALIALMLWHGKKQPVETPPTAPVETNAAPTAATVSSQPVSTPVHTNAPPPRPATNAVQAPPQSKWEQMQPILATQNDIPIVFYGRLEDQFGSPVVGAQIAASVRIYNGVQSTVERFSVTSDANGFFQINHGKGENLGLMPHKAGYALASTGTLFKYSHLESQPYIPDQSNPTVIKMWKLQGAESLVSIDQHYKLHYTGEPMNFDLLTGKIVPAGGDIKVTVNRPAGDVSARNRQDWSVQVEVVNGGLMDSGGQEAVTYAAPESGYEPSDTLKFSAAERTWSEMFNRGFFVQSRNGQVYSKLGISFRINSAPDDFMYVTFGGVANANHSRNWEGDANTMQSVGQ
jgi:hypothetical protein